MKPRRTSSHIWRALLVAGAVTLVGLIAGASRLQEEARAVPVYSVETVLRTPPEAIQLGLAAEGITVAEAKVEELAGAADPAQAVAIARKGFGFYGGDRITPYLVRYSDEQLGETLDDGETVTPYYVNQLVWMVVIDNARIPVFGPVARSEEESYYTAPYVIVLDARDLNFLTGVSA